MSPAPRSRLRLENVDGVTVVSFADTRIVDEEVVKEVGEQLYDLIDVQGHKKILVNFGNVESCASIMLGKLVNLQKKVAALQGKLKLCGLKPDLLYIFRLTQLDKVLEIHPDEQAALDKY